MKKYRYSALALAAIGAVIWLISPLSEAAPAAAEMIVYKTPWCGCCGNWVDHIRNAGFTVDVREMEDLRPIRSKLGVPEALGSCHTAAIGGYAIEGHVPAKDIRRLLAQKPKALGLAVPGMKLGSPGMEQDGQSDPYDVLLFSANGSRQVFASY